MLSKNQIVAAARLADSIVESKGMDVGVEYLATSNHIEHNELCHYCHKEVDALCNLFMDMTGKETRQVLNYLFGAWMDGFLSGFLTMKSVYQSTLPVKLAELFEAASKNSDPLQTIAEFDVSFEDLRYIADQRSLRLALAHAGIDPRTVAQRESEKIDLPDESLELLPFLRTAWIAGFTLALHVAKPQS